VYDGTAGPWGGGERRHAMRDVDKGSSLDGWDKRESHSTARDAAIVPTVRRRELR
jgi:hypothetical protein